MVRFSIWHIEIENWFESTFAHWIRGFCSCIWITTEMYQVLTTNWEIRITISAALLSIINQNLENLPIILQICVQYLTLKADSFAITNVLNPFPSWFKGCTFQFIKDYIVSGTHAGLLKMCLFVQSHSLEDM